MEAMILAAGLGSRLRPLTNDKPKALVSVAGITLLMRAMRYVIDVGATRVIVNVHHFADQIENQLHAQSWPVPVLVSDEREQLLDTGGALKHAQLLFGGKEPILVHNVDVLSRIDLGALLQQHQAHHAWATLAVSQRDSSRQLLWNEHGELCGWCNQVTGEQLLVGEWDMAQLQCMAFSGIAMVEPRLISLLPPADRPYPIIPEYLKQAATHRIDCFVHAADQWLDVGKPETLRQATAFLNR